jgi:type I restriction enzyme S subunit
VPVPPLAEQQRIVAKLDEIDADLRTLTEHLDAEYLRSAQVRPSITNDLMTRTAGSKMSIGDILTLEYGKPLEPLLRDPSASVPVYGANGIKTFTSTALHEEPTIVVGRKGSAGELTLVDGPCWPLDVTYYVVHNKTESDLRYLRVLLEQCELPSLAKGVKPGINRNEVYGLDCVVPPLLEQQRIVAKLDEVQSACSDVSTNLERRKAKASELRQSVLAAAFRGEL